MPFSQWQQVLFSTKKAHALLLQREDFALKELTSGVLMPQQLESALVTLQPFRPISLSVNVSRMQPPISFTFNTSSPLWIYLSDRDAHPSAKNNTACHHQSTCFEYGAHFKKRFPRECVVHLTIEAQDQCSVGIKLQEVQHAGSSQINQRTVQELCSLPSLSATERRLKLKEKVHDIVKNSDKPEEILKELLPEPKPVAKPKRKPRAQFNFLNLPVDTKLVQASLKKECLEKEQRQKFLANLDRQEQRKHLRHEVASAIAKLIQARRVVRLVAALIILKRIGKTMQRGIQQKSQELKNASVYVRQCEAGKAERMILGFLRAHKQKTELTETVMSWHR